MFNPELKVTRRQLHAYLANAGPELSYLDFCEEFEEGEVPIDAATHSKLRACELKKIVADSEMSEHHLGGDHLVSLADEVVAAIKDGYTIATWYGDKAEALVVGYKPDQFTLIDE